jgi:hypothetical protein
VALSNTTSVYVDAEHLLKSNNSIEFKCLAEIEADTHEVIDFLQNKNKTFSS